MPTVGLFNPETGEIDPTKIVLPGALRGLGGGGNARRTLIGIGPSARKTLLGIGPAKKKGKGMARKSKKGRKRSGKKPAHMVKGSKAARDHMAKIRRLISGKGPDLIKIDPQAVKEFVRGTRALGKKSKKRRKVASKPASAPRKTRKKARKASKVMGIAALRRAVGL